MATINKLDDYYKASPEDIINVGSINADGSFLLSGDNLPLESRFYRLYLIKEESSEFDACLYVGGDDHNFIHLILDNNSSVRLEANSNHFAPFGNYSIEGDPSNHLLKDLGVLIFPSFYFYQIKFPSELQFSEQKLNRDLFHFADTCQNIMVALSAIANTDMDKYFDLERHQYEAFEERLFSEMPKHRYTNDYVRKMKYFGGELETKNHTSLLWLLVFGLCFALFGAVLKIFSLRKQLKASTPSLASPHSFTAQEKRILSLIALEKTNKEIAKELFIEVSTVKTHINKLYSKLGVKSRNEAKNLSNSILSSGD